MKIENDDILISSEVRKSEIRLMTAMSRNSEDRVFEGNGKSEKSETNFVRLKALVKDLLTREDDEEWKDL